jgi:hypothetical protein
MEYSIRCSCGEKITFAEGAAGTNIRCACGATLSVPSMAQLRSQVGLLSQTACAPEVICGMIAAGSLPTRSDCARCGLATTETVDIRAEWKLFTDDTPVSALSTAMGVLLGTENKRYRVQTSWLNFRVRMCSFCSRSREIARATLGPGLVMVILLSVASVVMAFWTPWSLMIFAYLIPWWFITFRWRDRRRQKLIRKLIAQEPIYNQLLEQDELSEAVFQMVSVTQSGASTWPPSQSGSSN